MRCCVVIPSRLDAQRLPRKPLLEILGKPLIARVLMCAQSADIGDVFVACCGKEIEEIVQHYGGKAIVTDPSLPSGTDRVWSALSSISSSFEPDDLIVNLQGDMPFVPPNILAETVQAMRQSRGLDIMTPIALYEGNPDDSNRVKVVCSPFSEGNIGEAHYFSRSPIPYKSSMYYEHIGIYVYRYASLQKFVETPPSELEKIERLEQLRAFSIGLRIGVCRVNQAPISVDTLEDLNRVCQQDNSF